MQMNRNKRGMTERLRRMQVNPAGDWSIADVEAVCREYGIRRAAAVRRRLALQGVPTFPA
jgi:hypothetical protein